MPRSLVTAFLVLFWLLLGLALLAAVLMAIPQTAVYLRILQLSGGAYLGILTPLGITATRVSFLLTNLWWILLLAVPFVALLRRNWIVGLAIFTSVTPALVR